MISPKPPHSLVFLLKGGMLALLYWLAGQLVPRVSSGIFVEEGTALVWLPAGIGLVMILRLGFRGGPLLLLADLALRLGSDLPLGMQLAFSAGQMLEAMLGAWLLRRAGFHPPLHRMQDVLSLGVLGGFVSTLPGSLLDGMLLQAGGLLQPGSYGWTVLVWWLGDLCGVLLVGTLLLVWHQWPAWTRRQWLEALILWSIALGMGVFVFLFLFPEVVITPLKFLFFPLLFWVALRLQFHGVTVFTILVSGTATYHLLQLSGTPEMSFPREGLFYLYGFLLTLNMTGLVAAAITCERRAAIADLMEARDTLEARIAARTAALEVAAQQQRQELEERMAAEAALQQHARRLQVLRRIEQAILSVDSPQAIAEVVLDGLYQLIPCYRISITLFDTVRNELEWVAVRSVSEAGPKVGMRHPYSPSEQVQGVGRGEMLLIRDIEAEPERTPLLENLRQERIRSLVNMPLMRPGGPFLGTLNVLSQEVDAFTEAHLELIQEVSVPLAIALQQAQLHQQVVAYSAELEQRVAERTWALDETVRQLEREVAERRHAEAALRESEARYRLVLNTVQEGIFVMGVDFRFQEANASAVRLFGAPGDQLDTWFQENAPITQDGLPMPPEERPARKTLITGLPCHNVVMGIPRPDGALLWISINTYPLVREGETKPYAAVASFRDITEQLRTEAALQQSEAQARLVFDTITEGLLVIDGQRQIIASNASADRILGLPSETLWSWVATHPVVHEDLTPYVQEDQPSYKALRGEAVSNQVMGYERPDGVFIWLLVNAKPLFQDESLHPYAVVESFSDITERRQQEAEIRSLNHDLRARALELESANKELESFSYSVSHDLRAPLRAISGFAEILAQRYPNQLDETGKHYLSNIVEAATHMDRLIKDLLTYSRLGRFAIERQPVNLSGVLDWVVQALQNRIQETGATLYLPPRLPVLPANVTLLEQIFLNLFENALKYTRLGVAPVIEVRCKANKGKVLVAVKDNGEGIPEEYLEKIFRVFQRLHGAETHAGTGIGLAIVRKAVTLLNGEVWVESTPGQGSTFYLRLPLQ